MPVMMMKAIGKRLPQHANVDALKGKMRQIANKRANYVKSSYEQTVSDWALKPTFIVASAETSDRIGFDVSYTDEIYKFLDWGTRERWALMSDDFISKTVAYPKTLINSRAGQGHAVLRGQMAMEAHGVGVRPGIEPRHWTIMFRKDARFYFYKDIRELLKNWRMFS
jgi:hypothetical protein